jgi:hypothetical protein
MVCSVGMEVAGAAEKGMPFVTAMIMLLGDT